MSVKGVIYMKVKKGSKILVYGDSITDAGRSFQDRNDLGKGYCLYLQEALAGKATVINRGVGGDRSIDLLKRYEKDVLAEKPDYIIILIGINDVWHQYALGKIVTDEEFQTNMETLLEKIRQDLNIPVLLIEPFIIDIDPEKNRFYQELYPRVLILRRLASKFCHEYLTLEGRFREASVTKPPVYWSEDGVHPTAEGHKFIANEILKKITVTE